MAQDENNGSFRRVVYGVLAVLLTGWVSWVSVCAIGADKRVTVMESSFSYMRQDISEIKGGIKDISSEIKDIRGDQVRRERKEHK
jgi:hypothetical protein